MGISTLYSIIDIIHQVDLDDFIDVANSLRPNTEKSMVIRMKRFDNSFRWMLTKVKRCISSSDDNSVKEYIELSVSDILAMEKERNNYKKSLLENNQIMATQGNIYFTYDCNSNNISFYSYVDNKIMEMSECPLSVWIKNLIDDSSNNVEIINDLHNLHEDFINCKSDFFYNISSNFFSYNREPENLNIKASTIFEKMKPVNIVGCIQNIDNYDKGYSKTTCLHSREDELFSFNEVNNYVDENIIFNPKCQISLILMQIDNLDKIREQKGDCFVNQLYSSVLKTAKELVDNRGVVGTYKFGIIYIAIKNITTDLNTRAFLVSLRSQISWNCKLMNHEITTSIGISRRPLNGFTSDLLFKKALKALNIANDKGINRFIIYLESVHGDVE